ncbi:two-component regulator propeller domain-containing protein [Salinispira pacifica]|nr:two-component regulator propeller domain-containing protein [Salinispira pacifica]
MKLYRLFLFPRASLFRAAAAALVAIAIPGLLAAQSLSQLPDDPRVEQIEIQDGLINSNVSSIIQDDRGFMWIGTTEGLNRFDGYEFRSFTYIPFDTNSLSQSQIQTMHLDSRDNLWVGTYGGLNRLNTLTEDVESFEHNADDDTSLSSNLIISILRDSQERLWVGTSNGLNLSTDGGQTFQRFYHRDEDPHSLGDNTIRAIHEDNGGRIWIGHYGGVSIWDDREKGFLNISGPSADREDLAGNTTLPGSFVMDITQDSRGDIWLGLWGGSIVHFKDDGQDIQTYSIPDDGIYTLLFDSNGILWIGTWSSGLYAMNPRDGNFRQFSRYGKEEDQYHDLIYSLHEDRGGILWIGTRGGGIQMYDPKRSRFQVFEHESGTGGISPGSYTTMAEDSEGTIWIGTYNSGINAYNPVSGTFTGYSRDGENGRKLENNFVLSTYTEKMGEILVGTQVGLHRYDSSSDSFVPVEGPFRDQIIQSVTRDSDGNLIVGTYYNGLYIYDPSRDDYRHFANDPANPASISDNLISSLYVDRNNTLWVGTNNGLNRFTEKGFTRYFHDPDNRTSISGNKISSIQEDSYGQLWVGTNGGGINLYNPQQGNFTHYTTRNGLANNTVHAITVDDEGRLWISTTRGISILDPNEENFVNLDEDDGLVHYEMTSAAVKSRSGDMYFASVAAVHRIQNIDYVNNQHIPPVQITGIEIAGERIISSNSEELQLPYKENFITFNFSALDFSDPDKNRYSYKLEGIDQDWSPVSGENFAVYTNLAPGRYRFLVKGSNNDGVWNPRPTEFSFRISPPWYLSPIALSLAILFVAVFLGLMITNFRVRWKLNNERLKKEAEMNRRLEHKVTERTKALQRARQDAEEGLQTKSRFLANMSHDIRTPLNSIIGFSEMISRTEDRGKLDEYAATIFSESNKLLSLINQILDLSKIESRKMPVELRPVNLDQFVREITASYHDKAARKNLSFATSISAQLPPYLVTDPVNLSRILENVLSNSLKFTKEGEIRLDIEPGSAPESEMSRADGRQDNEPSAEILRFIVRDSGIGIPEEKQEIIFSSFEQIDKSMDREYPGSGLGMSIARELTETLGGKILLRSRPGHGSTFTIEIPVHHIENELQLDESGGESTEHINLQGKRILLVEDYLPNQAIVQALLESTGAELTTAENGAKALDLCEGQNFDIILMDLHMPGMDGLEVTRRLRTSGANSTTVILGLTADVMKESRERCLAAGMNDVLTKPIRQRTLMSALQFWLNQSESNSSQAGESIQMSEADAAESGLPGGSRFPVVSVPRFYGQHSRSRIFDYQGLLDEYGDAELIRELCNGFIASAHEGMAHIQEILEKPELDGRDLRELHREGHSMKGGAINLMAIDLAEKAEELERLAKKLAESEESEEIRKIISSGEIDRLTHAGVRIKIALQDFIREQSDPENIQGT